MTQQPSTHMVSQLIVEEMMTWKATSTPDQRRTELYAMADRLIRYFAVMNVTIAPAPGLPGLPGGPAIG